MEALLYMIILVEITLIFTIIVYKYFLDPNDYGSGCFGFQRRGRRRNTFSQRNSPIILLDDGYQRFIQGSESCEEACDNMDELSTRCVAKALKRKAQNRRVTFEDVAAATPKYPVVIGLFSTEKPISQTSRTPRKILVGGKTPFRRRLRFDEEDYNDDYYDDYDYDIEYIDSNDIKDNHNITTKMTVYKTPRPRGVTVYHSPGSLWTLRNRRDRLDQIEVAIGDALTRGGNETLRSCLVELLEMTPETEEDRVRQGNLVRFIKAKLSRKN